MAIKQEVGGALQSVKQLVRSLNRKRLRQRREGRRARYADWVARHDTLTPARRDALARRMAALPATPVISVLMPVYEPDLRMLQEAIDSVRVQMYPHWELCIADDCSPTPAVRELLQRAAREEPRIRLALRERNGHISAASNSALELARGEFLALMDHDDVLPPHALLLVAEAAARFPQAGLIYSDEDKIGPTGEREEPYFKSDWNYELFLSQNMISHLGCYRTALVREVGGFRLGYEGSQDYDLALRCVERLQPEQIVHVPHVLYHWRVHPQSTAAGSETKPYAIDAARRSLVDHLARIGQAGSVHVKAAGRYRVEYALPDPAPLVTAIVPTRNQLKLLRTCIESLLHKTRYPALEIIVVDNGSDDAATLAWLQRIAQDDPRVRVLRDDSPFNYSALNNLAARQARGEYLALVNNDIEVIEPDWLREMVSQAARPGVGAVGAKLLYPDDTVQHGGVILGIDKGDGRGGVAGPANKGLARRKEGYGFRGALTQSFSAVTAACLVVRRALYDEVGGLDAEHLAVTYNDVDFCLRLRERGYRNVWTPYALLYHHESVSRGRDAAPRNRERFEREAAYMRQRWAGVLGRDPAYNPNLNIEQGDFALGDPPRVGLERPWFER